MSLVHDDQILYGGNTHSGILAGPWEKPLQIGSFFDLQGESHIIAQSQGRDLTCDVDAVDYATETGLVTAISVIQNLANRPLTGSLVITYPSERTITFQNCTFIRIDERDEPQQDASDGTFWQPLTFVWRQAK